MKCAAELLTGPEQTMWLTFGAHVAADGAESVQHEELRLPDIWCQLPADAEVKRPIAVGPSHPG